MTKLGLPYALMQGAAWAMQGSLYCYSSVFLLSQGLSNTQIGVLMGGAVGACFVGQVAFGAWLNGRGRRGLKGFLLLCAAALLALDLALLARPGRAGGVACFLGICLFLQLVPPFLNAACMYELQLGREIDFGLGRGCGSLGYATCSIWVGGLIARSGPGAMFAVGGVLGLVLLGSILWFYAGAEAGCHQPPRPAPTARQGLPDARFLRTYRRYGLFLAGTVLLMLGHTFLSNFLYQVVAFKGGDEAATGVAAAVAAFAEIPVMFVFARMARRVRCDRWLKVSCVFLILKMLLTCLAGSLILVELIQVLQMAGYALFAVSSVYYTGTVIPHRDVVSGQAWLSAAVTLGVLLSLLLGGAILDRMGVPALLMTGVAAMTAGTAVVFRAVQPVGAVVGAGTD